MRRFAEVGTGTLSKEVPLASLVLERIRVRAHPDTAPMREVEKPHRIGRKEQKTAKEVGRP